MAGHGRANDSNTTLQESQQQHPHQDLSSMNEQRQHSPPLEERQSNPTATSHDASTNDTEKQARNPLFPPKPGKASMKDRLNHFTWSWFAATMATGAIAVVLANTPFRFAGLDVIAKIFFILDLFLFVLFNCCITYRFIRRPKIFLRSLQHPGEALFFGAYWVTVALLLNLTQTYGVPVCGPWLSHAMRVFYWIYCGCALCVAIFQYATLFVAEKLPVDGAMPAWVFPVYPFLVIGPLAAVITKTQDADASLPIWGSGVSLQGVGFTVALFMYSIYYQRLMTSALPAPSSRPGMYISVGPVGYTAAALVNLADQAPKIVPMHWLEVDTLQVPDVIRVVMVLAGLWLWLLGFWFCALTTVAIVAGVCGKEKMEFTLQWWGFVFPNAGMVLATINLGNVLQSDGVKAVASAMTVLLVVAWFGVAIANVLAVVQGKILWPGRDEDAPDTKED